MAATSTFGTEFAPVMATSRAVDGAFDAPRFEPIGPLSLHPGSHALHYSSSCFEGLKAHKGVDGITRVFRLDRHVERLRTSARLAHLPIPDPGLLRDMIVETVVASLEHVPDPPWSLYVRPVLIGTDRNIGAAASPSRDALLYVLASPVDSYFSDGERALSVGVETHVPRSTPQLGRVKAGANYLMALGPTLEWHQRWGVDQVLFCPGGALGETGASNFLLLDQQRVVTPALDGTFLEGVTRDSLLVLARDLGLDVEERRVDVEELGAWAGRPDAEAALAGTAAVLAGVGTLVIEGRRVRVGSGDVGAATTRLRRHLQQIHWGQSDDRHGWMTPVGTRSVGAP